MRTGLALAAAACLLAPACVHPQSKATAESLRTANETFFRFLRWSMLREASQMVVPEARKAWIDAALDAKDDEDLKVIEYDLSDVQMASTPVTTEYKVTWHRLPSISTKTERVTVEWVDREGVWFVNSIKGGPLPLVAPPPPAPDAGVAAR